MVTFTPTPAPVLPVGVAIPAAGSGVRMGGRGKAFLEVGGHPLLWHTLQPILGYPGVEQVVVAVAPGELPSPPAWLIELDPRIRLVEGGATRSESVLAALRALPPGLPVVLVHDAARPLLDHAMMERCTAVAAEGTGAVAGWPIVDTLKEVDSRGQVVATPPRARMWGAQTPQAFPLKALREAYERALAEGVEGTDDAAIFAWAGGRVQMVEGGRWNLKVTHPEDLPLATWLLAPDR